MQVTFVDHQGGAQSVSASTGHNLMETAVAAGIDNIAGECGGVLACATCHVHVPDEWRGRIPPPSEAELDMLDMAVGRDERSRLACQIVLTEDMDGLTIDLAESLF